MEFERGAVGIVKSGKFIVSDSRFPEQSTIADFPDVSCFEVNPDGEAIG